MRTLGSGLLLLSLTSAAPVLAQQVPLQTEDADTATAGRLFFETAFDAISSEPSYVTGAKRTRWDGPLLRFVYSPAANVELDVEWVVRVGAGSEPGREAHSEPGDVTLRAKWRFLEARGSRPALAARFGVTLPETSYNDVNFKPLGLGPNTLRAFAQGLSGWRWGRTRLDLNLGLLVFDEVYRPHEQRDFLLYGLALAQGIGRRLEVVTEIAGRLGDGNPGAEERSEARLGLRFGRGRVRAAAAVRRGLAPADGTWGGTVGLSWGLRSGGSTPSPVP
jgi:hypothetical protein